MFIYGSLGIIKMEGVVGRELQWRENSAAARSRRKEYRLSEPKRIGGCIRGQVMNIHWVYSNSLLYM